MDQKKSAVRFAAFAGVMVVMSGLVLTLFDEARAVDVEFENAPTTAQGQTTYTVNVKVPQNTRIPVESVVAFIEQGSSNADPKQGATLVTRSTCDFSAVVTASLPASCTNGDIVAGASPLLTLDDTLARPNGVIRIEFNGFFAGQVGTGYEIGYGYVFGNGPLTGTTTGYGYDPVFGYGYGAPIDSFGPGNGYGYGYTDDLFLQFDVVIVGNQLAAGTHFLTVGVDTGSPTLGGVLYSPATQFTAVRGGGGSTGDGGSGDGGSGDGGRPSVTITTTTNPNPPSNSVSSFTGSIQNQPAGTRVVIETGDPRINDVEIVLGLAAGDATVEVSRFTPENPPEGVGALPPGVTVSDFVQVKITIGGQTHVLSFAVEIPQNDAGDPDKAVLLKYNPNSGKWVPQQRIQLTLSEGKFTGRGSSECCSDFAVAFDEQDPTVALSVSSGALSGIQTITAEAADNLEVGRVEFFFGETLLGSDDEAPYTWDFDTKKFPNGAGTVKAVAYDYVGNTAEASQPVTLQNEQAPSDGGGDGTDGGEPAPKKGGAVTTFLLIALVVVVIVGAGLYFMRQQKK